MAILLIKLVQFQCNITFLVWQKISLKIVRSGFVDPPVTAGTFRLAGFNGNDWSSRAGTYTSSTAATTYYLAFLNAIYPSYENHHYYGFPLRCLSTVLDM